MIQIRFTVRYQTRCQKVALRFWVQISIRLVPVLIQNVGFCCDTFENGVLLNGQQPVSAVNNFIDQGEFGALKTLSGHIAPPCDKNQFCDKMTVST